MDVTSEGDICSLCGQVELPDIAAPQIRYINLHPAGVLAPILLVVLRFVQGLGVGGEWAGAVLVVVEHADAHRRGYYAR